FSFAWEQAGHPMRGQYLYAQRSHIPPLRAYPYDLKKEIQVLEQKIATSPNNANLYFALGDLLYFEAYWLSAAIPLYEKGLSLDSGNLAYHWRLYDLYLN